MTAAAVEYAEKRRDQIKKIQQAQRSAANEIGDLLPVADPARKAACERDLFAYLQLYFPASTGLSPFSDDHKRVIARIQDCIFGGGRFAELVYRGFAKTTIAQNTATWALSYGHRTCIPIFGATDDDAVRNMQSIKLELETNDLLLDDFPEICQPIRALQGRPQRCASQTYKGEPTHIEWTADKIVLPTIAGSKSSGGIVVSRGLTGASRGLVFKRTDGTNQRPDFAIIDDPQTDESATSPSQVEKRLDIIKRSILKSAGHFRQLACVVTCTVRASNDVAEQLSNFKLNPSWQSERIKMVRHWADEHGEDATLIVPKKWGPLWGQYRELRNTFDHDNPHDQKRAWKEATAFYVANQEAMDAGCLVSWVGCFDREHEVSAIQHAYNILIDDGPDVFTTECQNGTPEDKAAEGLLTAVQICEKVNGYDRGIIPTDAQHLTAFIDVQDAALPWMVCAWRSDFTGYIVDYGFYPDQKRAYVLLRDATPTLADKHPGSLESGWHAGLTALTTALLGSAWQVAGGGTMSVGRCLIDANYGSSTESVWQFIRQSPYKATLLPTHGVGIKATRSPMQFWPIGEGEKVGLNWRERASAKHKGRYGLFDTNYWKTFFHTRLAVPVGSSGCLSLFQAEPPEHRMLADHLLAEFRILVDANGRKVYEWQEYPEKRDNHFLDCLVGCCVGASMQGAVLESLKPAAKKPKQTLAEMKARAG
jgi:hypothetical protein